MKDEKTRDTLFKNITRYERLGIFFQIIPSFLSLLEHKGYNIKEVKHRILLDFISICYSLHDDECRPKNIIDEYDDESVNGYLTAIFLHFITIDFIEGIYSLDDISETINNYTEYPAVSAHYKLLMNLSIDEFNQRAEKIHLFIDFCHKNTQRYKSESRPHGPLTAERKALILDQLKKISSECFKE